MGAIKGVGKKPSSRSPEVKWFEFLSIIETWLISSKLYFFNASCTDFLAIISVVFVNEHKYWVVSIVNESNLLFSTGDCNSMAGFIAG